jgi:hypothetical protein
MIKESRHSMNETPEQSSMLDYAKIILPKVSFSKSLFSKELKKCIRWVEKDQLHELYSWCYSKFGDTYADVLSEAFANVAA